jgi:hypothetical protein
MHADTASLNEVYAVTSVPYKQGCGGCGARNGDTGALQNCNKGVTRVLQGCYKGVARLLQGYLPLAGGPCV